MKANSYLAVRVENNVAVFTMPFQPGYMRFIGANCRSSAEVGEIAYESISVTVPTGEKAVVVIRSTHRTNEKLLNDILCVIPITWENGKMFVDLEQPFVPAPDRLLQVTKGAVEGFRIIVITGDQKFVCAPLWKEEELVGKGYRVINDPNLLLRFAVGEATLEDLEAVATLDKRSQTERELTQVQTELAELRKEYLSTREDYQTLVDSAVDTIRQAKDAIINTGNQKTRFGFLSWIARAKAKAILTKR